MEEKSKEITQEMMKNARVSGNYEDIWISRGKCVFCDLKDKYILYEENGVVLTISLYPYIDGHIMAIPRRHVKSNKELTQLEWNTMRKFSYLAKKMFKKAHGHKGMWTLIKDGADAQSTVGGHLHMHFIPFDKADLCNWNYRELKFTPLENVSIYKKLASKFQKANTKYEQKYKNQQDFPIVVDLVVVNKKNQVLVEERKQQFKFAQDYYSLPGGHVDNSENGLLGELKREVKEETGIDLDENAVELVHSDFSQVTYKNDMTQLGASMPLEHTFLWNVYLWKGFDEAKQKLVAGDDCEKLVWLDLSDLKNNPRLSPGVRTVLEKVIYARGGNQK